ncbi:MAG: TIGR03619 family F420-dependent LLM class oxidoreductase [Gammaproteobacteria bacterium]
MQLAMNIRNWGPTATPAFLRDCAAAADRSTLDAIWFNDHIGLPPVIADNAYGIPDAMGAVLDPLGFACWLAAVTERIAFGTAVLVVPYRPPLLTNKLVTTVQVLSGSRFRLGVGPGYLAEEFRALGVPRSRRGALTDEILAFLHASARDPLIEANGQALRLEPTLPLPPIYVGGKAEVALARALRHGDGWMPVGMLPADLVAPIAELQERAAEQGRGLMEVIAMKTLPLDDRPAAAALVRAYRDAGVTQLVHTQAYDSPAHYAEVVAQVDGELRAALR